MINPLLDKIFLKQLDLYNNKIIYARVSSLTRDELPVEEITGTVTEGSISIDGSSSVRRTCNLTMVVRKVDITDYYWTLKTKIKLEIGVQNDIDDRYPEIIWFPQGIYVLTSFSSSYATNNCTISLSGKDKMCLLNGELGGVFNSEVCLSEIDESQYSYEGIALTPEQFFASCEKIIVQNNKDLKLNKYNYYDFSEAVSYITIDKKEINSSRLKGEEVFAIINEETGEYEITTVYSSDEDLVYYLVKIEPEKIKNITEIDEALKLYRQNKIYSQNRDQQYFLTQQVLSVNTEILNFILKEILVNIPLIGPTSLPAFFPIYNYVEPIIIQNIYTTEELTKYKEQKQTVYNPITDKIEKQNYNIVSWQSYCYYYCYYIDQDGKEVPTSLEYLRTDFPDGYPKIYLKLDVNSKPMENVDYFRLKANYFLQTEIVNTLKLPVHQIIKEMIHEYGNEPYHNIIINNIPKKGKELLEYMEKEPLYIIKEYDFLIPIEDIDWDNPPTEIEFTGNYRVVSSEQIKNIYASIWTKRENEDVFFKKPMTEKEFTRWGTYILNEDNEFEPISANSDYNQYANYYGKFESDSKVLIENLLDDQYGVLPGFYSKPISSIYIFEFFKKEQIGTFPSVDTIYSHICYGEIIRIQQDEVAGYRSTDLTYPDELILSPGETVTTALDKIKNMLGNYEYFYDLDGRFVFQEKKTFLNTAFSQFYSGDDTEQFIDYTKDKYVYTFSNNEAVVSVARSPAVGNIKNDFTIWGEKKTASGGTVPIHMRYAIDEKPITYVSWANSLEENQSEYPAKTYTTLPAPEVDKQEDIVYNCDWRELIYQMALDFRKFGTYDPLSKNPIQDPDFNLTIRGLNPDLCDEKGLTGYEQYYIDLQGFWRVLYNPFYSWENNENYNQEDYFMNSDSKFQYWTQQLKEPENLIFWFDFLDTTGDLGKFSIKEIGHRAMAKTEDSVTAIKFRDIPPIIYTTGQEEDIEGTGFDFIKVEPAEMETMFSVSSQGTDAETWINDNIYKNALATETITLNTIPIYYLKPNALIDLITSDIYLNGEYIINKISYSLSHNGTMTISAIKNQPYIV